MTAIENFHDSNWATAAISFRRTDGTEGHKLWILNLRSEKGYNHEEACETAFKCGMISLGLPFFALFKVACYVLRAVTLTFGIIGQAFVHCAGDFSWKHFKRLVLDITFETPRAIIECIWSIVKTPFCFIAMEFCCLCGMASPLIWRVHLANVESFWCGTLKANFTQENITRRLDFKESKAKHCWERMGDFLSNRHSPYCFHMAYCFQPLGSLRDPHIIRPYQILAPSA